MVYSFNWNPKPNGICNNNNDNNSNNNISNNKNNSKTAEAATLQYIKAKYGMTPAEFVKMIIKKQEQQENILQ